MNTQLTDNEALELKALIAPSYPELEKIEDLEEVKQYLLGLTELDLINRRTDITILPESIVKLTQLTALDLMYCKNLITLPESIGNLTQLTKLDLRDCENLTTLPESIGNLKQLTQLYLTCCQSLIMLPESIGNLKQLTQLYLTSCQSLTTLPEKIGNLTRLVEFDFSWCKNLTALPESIGNLKQIKELSLYSCESLIALPESIGNLEQLTGELYLTDCKNLITLPESIGNLTQLQGLDLYDCESLTTLPESIGNLKQLTSLGLRGCKNLTMLPESICNLTQISELDLYGCESITMLPKNIGALISLKELKCKYKNMNTLPLSFLQLINLKEDYLQVVLQKINQIDENEHRKLLDILLCVLKIREELIVKDSSNDYEKTVAHYTRPDIAMKLLKQEKDENDNIKTNPFQMSSIAYVNDPKEGKVIFDYLNQLKILKGHEIKPVSTLNTFVGCFTFNHDSLNQFRLYGKEQGKEATGVSIVINNDFFSYEHGNVYHKNNKEQQKNKLPLYRCIYLNPKGELNGKPYIQVACRDKVTFYREKGRTDKDWKNYMTYIEDIQNNVNRQFEKIPQIIQLLFNGINNKTQLIETVSLILMPLSYMVKHSAYEEEQECRIFKFLFVDFNNPDKKIQIDTNNKRMYMEYLPIYYYHNKPFGQPHVDTYVKKIYLSPYAEQYADMFRILTNDRVEVRSSDNPFR